MASAAETDREAMETAPLSVSAAIEEEGSVPMAEEASGEGGAAAAEGSNADAGEAESKVAGEAVSEVAIGGEAAQSTETTEESAMDVDEE